jgi:GntR family transcriptional regulator
VPKTERPDPPYMQVVRHFRDRILTGQLKDCDTLPPIRALAREHSISPATASKVINTLVAEGLVVTRPGAGTTVRSHDVLHRSAIDHIVTAAETGRIYPAGNYARILDADVVTVPTLVAAAFDLKPDALVIRRRRTTYSQSHQPLSSSTSWYHGDLVEVAPLLLNTERITQGTIRYVLEMTGRADRHHYAEVMHSASNATATEAGDLGINEGDTIERTRNYFRDDDGGLIEFGTSSYRKDIWSYYHTAPQENA